jgi:hypothetical protein
MPTKINCVNRADNVEMCPCQLKIYQDSDYDLESCGDLEDIRCHILNMPRREAFGEGTVLGHKEEYNKYVDGKKAAILSYHSWYEHTYG